MDRHPHHRALFLLPVVALTFAGCSGDGDGVSIDDAWARATAAGQTVGAVYFDLAVDEDDTLLSASVPSSVAAEAQIHEVVMTGDAMAGDEMDEASGEADESDGRSGSEDMGETSDDMVETSDDMAETSDDMGETSDDMGETDDMGGAMRMQELPDGLALTGGETVTFEPGGYHVMLLDLAEPLEVGDGVELTLQFAEAGSVTLTVEVAETSP